MLQPVPRVLALSLAVLIPLALLAWTSRSSQAVDAAIEQRADALPLPERSRVAPGTFSTGELAPVDVSRARNAEGPRGAEVDGDQVGLPSGDLEVSIVGLDAYMAAHIARPGAEATVRLDEPSGPGAAEFARWSRKASLTGGVARLLDVPIDWDYRLSIHFEGTKETIQMPVTGPRASEIGPGTRLEIDLAGRQERQNAAIATLRSIAAAQQQLQASAAIDTDADGGGEFGYFGEAAGTAPMRVFVAGASGAVGGPLDRLDPTYLPHAFGTLESTPGGGILRRNGYLFQIFLPGPTADRIRGIPESIHGGADVEIPDASNAEIMWCCYAWPAEEQLPPHHAYFINQAGDVLETENVGARRYIGPGSRPRFDAAFARAGDMGSEPALAAAGLRATDGRTWGPETGR